MKVLWLASWFPNRTNPSTGDFIERHAAAVAPFVKQLFLVAIIKDETMQPGTVEIQREQRGNQFLYRVYYAKSRWGKHLEKLLSFWKYFRLQKQIYREIEAEFGKPNIVHVQVAMKAGLFARWLKKKKAVPYLVTEHFTGYNKMARPNMDMMGSSFKYLNKLVLKDTVLLLPVSDNLGNIINTDFVSVQYKVVYNVVDTSLFFYEPGVINKFRFVHPSYMNYQKNPDGILAACKIVKDRGFDFEMLMLGNKDAGLMETAEKEGLLNQTVFFEAAVSYNEVAARMQQSGALLLFSRFENMPCIILEALCCGLPVVSTNVGGIAEVIDESNGILVENEKVEQLAAAMIDMIQNAHQYNREAIAAKATALFNYDTIGKQHVAIYSKIVQGK